MAYFELLPAPQDFFVKLSGKYFAQVKSYLVRLLVDGSRAAIGRQKKAGAVFTPEASDRVGASTLTAVGKHTLLLPKLRQPRRRFFCSRAS